MTQWRWFEEAVNETLLIETDRLTNNEADRGGLTKYGISQRAYPNVDIENLTREQAVEILRQDYWLKPGIYRLLDLDLAKALFDFGVHSGQKTAVKALQEAVNELFAEGLKVDGILGPITLNAVNRRYQNIKHARALRGYLCVLRGKRFIDIVAKDHTQQVSIRGWMARLPVK